MNDFSKCVGTQCAVVKRILILVLFWAALPCAMIRWPGADNRLQLPSSAAVSFDFTTCTDRLDRFGYIAFDTERGGLPAHSIYFDTLRTESGSLGWFKTGVHQTARITGLRLRLYSYNAQTNPGADAPSERPLDGEPLLDTLKRLAEACASGLQGPVGGSAPALQLDIANVNLRNVSEIRIRDFDYTAFDNDQRVIEVKSRLAQASCMTDDVILRGHVVITAASGDTLESNHVCWNRPRGCFEVIGGYVLWRAGTMVSGKNLLVDTQLNNIYSQRASLE
jgi:hypothetical protein